MKSLLPLALLLALAACTDAPNERPERLVERPAKLVPDEARGEGAAERMQLFLDKRLPAGETTLEYTRYEAAERHMARMPRHSTARRPDVGVGHDKAAPRWEWLGPGNVGGRMRTLAFHPQNPDVLFAGGVSGGVYRSTDRGGRWQALSDQAVNINIGSLLIASADAREIYAGTGELYRNSGQPYSAMAGAGVIKSVDGGVNWSRLPGTANGDFRYVADLVQSPNNPQRIYAATNTGVWRSNDGGSSWSQLLRPVDAEGRLRYEGCTELSLRPGTARDELLASCSSRSIDDRYVLPNTIYPPACGDAPCPASVFLNTDAGAGDAWSVVLNEPGMGRTTIERAPTNPDIVYALSASIVPGPDRTGDGIGDYDNGLHALFRSSDGGRTWQARVRNTDPIVLNTVQLTHVTGVSPSACGWTGPVDWYSAGWYNQALAIDPTDPEVVFAAGMDVYRSTDGGRNWGIASYWWAQRFLGAYLHSDVHGLRFDPRYDGTSNRRLYALTDGGVAQSDNPRASVATGAQAHCNPANTQVSWREISMGLGSTQFYTGMPFPDGTRYLGGLQDNGTLLGRDDFGPDSWNHIFGGDGAHVAVDPTNTRTIYVAYQNINIHKSIDGGVTFTQNPVTSGINDSSIFIMPYLMDPNASQRLYAGGTRVWRTINGAASWQPASAVLGDGTFFGHVSAIAAAPGRPGRLLVGTARAIHRADSALTSNPNTVFPSVSPRLGWVSSLHFDPSNADVAYATYSTFGGVHVWKSIDAGANWTPLDGTGNGTLPDIPVHSIVVHPFDPLRLYVGTDLGVFASVDGGAHWAVENTGFANVITETLAINPLSPKLFAFTYGRGAWRVPLDDLDGVGDYVIGADSSGVWYNAQQDGHGLVLEVIETPTGRQMVAGWYVYQDGKPRWLYGSGPVNGNRASVPVVITEGAQFPPAFQTSDVQLQQWGTLDFEFASADGARMEWHPAIAGFGSGSIDLVPLGKLSATEPSASSARVCHSGSWYAADQSGHGVQLQIITSNGQPTAFLTWYVYQDGQQSYLVGAAPLNANGATIPMVSTAGANFPPAFNANDVQRTPWGNVTIAFTGNDAATLSWAPTVSGFSSGTLALTRLTSLSGHQCQ